jgi:hypothetical protein
MAKRSKPADPPPSINPNVPSPRVTNPKDPYASGGSWGPVPVLTSGMTFSEVGSSGLRAFSGWVREEWSPNLVGRQGAQKYREMIDNNPTIGALMFTFLATMRKVEWRVVPPDDSGEARQWADFVESCMDDMSHPWEDLIAENLSMLAYGYAPHEIVYKRRLGREPGPDPQKPDKSLPTSLCDDGLIGWRRIPIRGQDTVLKWFFDEGGEIEGMTQQPWIGPLIDLPIEKMLLFRVAQHKNNPEGRSILRNSWVPYYYIKRLQEQEAILAERLGGVPLIKVPATLIEQAAAGNSQAAAALAAYKKIATNLRIDEQMGVVIPSDVWQSPTGSGSQPMYHFELVAPQNRGTSFNFDATIGRYNIGIMTSVLADFLQLGHEARGTQSLAVSKVDMFFQAVEGFLNSIAAVYNRYAIPRLWKLNGLDYDLMPTIEPDLAQRIDLDVLSNFILRLSQAGMPMFPNDDLQTYILDAGGLPDVADPRALQASGLLDNPTETNGESKEGDKPPADGALQKMLLASLARRYGQMNGPVSVRKRRRRRARPTV